jgi:hypothetical protein
MASKLFFLCQVSKLDSARGTLYPRSNNTRNGQKKNNNASSAILKKESYMVVMSCENMGSFLRDESSREDLTSYNSKNNV